MNTIHPSPLLRNALLADAAASGAVAALQLAAGATLAPLLQLPQPLLLETGLFLVAYVVLLLVLARSPRVPAALVQLVIVGNVGWAIGAAAVAFVFAPGALGLAFLLVHALTVLLFAGLERLGLRQSAAHATMQANPSRSAAWK